MPVREFLDSLHGKRVYFDPLHGNHGDRLLSLAAQAMLEQAQITLIDNPGSAEFILLNGGGSMVDGWFGLDLIADYSRKFPSHPLAVLPSSFRMPRRILAGIERLRTAPMWLWARERPSLDLLRALEPGDNVIPGLDHDLAFSLNENTQITTLRDTPVEDILLIVERDDWEGPTGRRRPLSPSGLEFIPEQIRTVIRRKLLGPIRKKQDQTSPFRAAAIRFVNQNRAEGSSLAPVTSDISLAETGSFGDFLHHVAAARVIVTTRLHVAILGHLLGRETYLVEGSYHKFRGVYEYSMQKGSCKLVNWSGQELEFS